MAKILPEPGTVVKNTQFTEVLTSGVPPKQETLTFWEYIQSLKPEEYGRHIAYVYRWLDNGDVAAAAKMTVPFDEFGLKDTVGGGSFRVILKNGAMICKRIEKVVIEGKPKNPDDAPSAVTTSPNHVNEMTLIAQLMKQQTELLERVLTRSDSRPLIDEGIRGAFNLQTDVFRGGVDAVRASLSAPASKGKSETGER